MRYALRFFVAFAIMVALSTASAKDAPRKIAVVVDTSGSMNGNDKPRYTILATQIVFDLLDESDELTVIRLKGRESFSCNNNPPDYSLAYKVNAKRRNEAKIKINSLLWNYESGNAFASPVRTAVHALGTDPASQRMLLFVADADDMGRCESTLKSELRDFKKTGATVAAITVRPTRGGTFNGPLFDYSGWANAPDRIIYELAAVYQRFLGAKKKVQTGPVGSTIEFNIDPLVKEAFLVVAAEGNIGALQSDNANPSGSLDLDYRGGGVVKGADNIERSYRIVRLSQPGEGKWRINLAHVPKNAGFMLLQDFAIGVRLAGGQQNQVPTNTDVPVEVEVFDERTGKIVDVSNLSGLDLTAVIDGREVPLRDDGTNGDRVANDGVFTVTTRFDEGGEGALPVRLRTDALDKTTTFVFDVTEAPWLIKPEIPTQTPVDSPVQLRARLEATTSRSHSPPKTLVIDEIGLVLDQVGSEVYEASWRPTKVGPQKLTFRADGSPDIPKQKTTIDVLGTIAFGPPIPVQIGEIGSHTEQTGSLDLSQTSIRGQFELGVTSNFSSAGSVLEIKIGDEWQPVEGTALTLIVSDAKTNKWPLRIRVGGCPGACRTEPTLTITQGSQTLTVPVVVTVVPDSIFVCYWWAFATFVVLVISAIFTHGRFIWPFSFTRQLVVQISPEEDIDGEGFPHPVSAVRGTGRGFYRHARAYVGSDYRLTSSPRGALARLRAERKRVMLVPCSGQRLQRMDADGEWKEVEQGEAFASYSYVYRNDDQTLYFQLRNRL
ncbi:MAG: VWA domain-containing protein [Proteobacteria bacterium]|nr:VWA domain-containing protein [Pseudomonadota bacterium]